VYDVSPNETLQCQKNNILEHYLFLVVLISDDGEDDRGRNIHDGTLKFDFFQFVSIQKERQFLDFIRFYSLVFVLR